MKYTTEQILKAVQNGEHVLYSEKSQKKTADAVRADAMELLKAMLSGFLTADNVTQTEISELTFSFGDTTLDTGETVEICVSIAPKIQKFDSGSTEKRGDYTAFDRIKRGEAFEDEQREKAEKKAAAAEKKAAKILKDQAAREKAAAEKKARESEGK